MVLVGVVAAGLLAVAVLHLLKGLRRETQSEQALNDQITRLTDLNGAEFSPTEDNVKLAREGATRLVAFQSGAQKLLADAPPPEMDDAKFRSLLENTLSELGREFSNATVTIPPKYAFTFGAQLGKLKYAPDSIGACYRQLQDIKALAQVLLQGKIHALEGLRRVRVSFDDPRGDSSYLEDQSVRTNSFSTIAPYEVTFKGFSTELAAVLNGLARTPEFFVVKNLTIQPADARQASAEGETPAPMTPAPQPSLTAAPKAGEKGVLKGGRPAPPRRTTLLDERPLRITLWVECVRPLPPAK